VAFPRFPSGARRASILGGADRRETGETAGAAFESWKSDRDERTHRRHLQDLAFEMQELQRFE